MKLKNFKSYSEYYSKDPKNFENRVALASTKGNLPFFENYSTFEDVLHLSKSTPLVIWGDFNFSNPNKLNENFNSTVYNQTRLPSRSEWISKFNEEPFIQKKIEDRSLVKKMKFPIIGVEGESEEEFKTFNRFKKSEKHFNYFKEKLNPNSRFEILVSGDTPLHAQKLINKIPFDINLKRWKYLNQSKNICRKINSKYSPEFYIISVLEEKNNLYLDSINRNTQLSPSQGLVLYESAYEKYYSSSIPFWVKEKMFESQVKPYYIKRYYDSLLLKPVGVIDYSKYVK